jgi:hypothetical protein
MSIYKQDGDVHLTVKVSKDSRLAINVVSPPGRNFKKQEWERMVKLLGMILVVLMGAFTASNGFANEEPREAPPPVAATDVPAPQKELLPPEQTRSSVSKQNGDDNINIQTGDNSPVTISAPPKENVDWWQILGIIVAAIGVFFTWRTWHDNRRKQNDDRFHADSYIIVSPSESIIEKREWTWIVKLLGAILIALLGVIAAYHNSFKDATSKPEPPSIMEIPVPSAISPPENLNPLSIQEKSPAPADAKPANKDTTVPTTPVKPSAKADPPRENTPPVTATQTIPKLKIGKNGDTTIVQCVNGEEGRKQDIEVEVDGKLTIRQQQCPEP